MKLLKILIRNFYSIKEIELDFTKYSGIVQVIGKNKDTGGSNGSGKSSIFEAVVWGIFGRTIRKSTEEALVNCDVKKHCEVILELEREGYGKITIHRGKKPTFLKVFINGEPRTLDHALRTQELIEATLETDYKTFVASILFGQHVDVDFLSSSAEDKRTIIRNFLSLDNIFSLRDKIRGFKSDYSTKIKIAEAIMKDDERRLNDKLNKLDELEEQKSDNSMFSEPMEDVVARDSSMRKLETELNKILSELSSIQQNKKSLKKNIESMSEDSTCAVCGSTLNKKNKDKCVTDWTSELDSLDKKLRTLDKKKISISEEITGLRSKPSLSAYIKFNETNKSKGMMEAYRKDADELKDKIKIQQDIRKSSEVGYEVMKFWEKAFSEQGLIKYFIKNILDYFNTKCNEYLSQLTNNQFTIVFNEELEETITNNGRNIHFISLSGGEKRKINLAVMLALQALLTSTSKKQCNIVFFDEVADNIDDDGILCLYNLLTSIKDESRTIFLISHNNYLKSLLDSTQNITIMKTRGESKLIESI